MHSDLRYAFRQLRKAPGLSVAIVLSLGLGIGALATVLCWTQAIVRNPIAGAVAQDELVVLVSNQGGVDGAGNLSLLDLREFDALGDVFAGAACSQITPAVLGENGRTDWSFGQITTANFFEVLGVRPILGRTFRPGEDLKPGGDPLLVISERLWQRRFGGDPSIIGRAVELNRHSFVVIGVVPARFHGSMTGVDCEFWAPISMNRIVTLRLNDSLDNRTSRGFHTVARLQPGVALETAQAAVATHDARLAAEYPASNKGIQHRVLPYSRSPFGAQSLLGPALRLLLAVSAGLLAIVVANVANLQLSRMAGRQTEVAIRVASGASRWRIARLFFVESVVLASLGSLVGLILAGWGTGTLGAFIPVVSIPLVFSYELDPTTLLATVVAGLVCASCIAFLPIVQVMRTDLHASLKESSRSATASAGHRRLRNLLVMAELALAIVLLIGAGLCVQGFRRARSIEPGLDARGILIAPLQIGMSGYSVESGRDFYRRAVQRLAGDPEVEGVALASWLPLGVEGCKGHGVDVKGYPRTPGENLTVEYSIVSPGYFPLLRIPLVGGRDFQETDTNRTEPVAIVNEAFANKFWPGQDAVGRTFRAAGRERTIIGVCRTGKYNRMDEAPHPFFHLPYQQYVPDLDLRLLVRTRGDPLAHVDLVSRTIHELDPAVNLWFPTSLEAHIQNVFFPHRTAAVLILCLGGAALALAAMGVYAVMAYNVSQRIPEFGIRLALGAQQRELIWHVQRQNLRLATLGIAAGIGLAFGATHLLTGFLFGLSPLDPLTFLAVPFSLLLVALLASWVPAWRASRVSPVEALRSR